MPPPIDAAIREQWKTLCCVATDVGLCPNEAADQNAPVKVCAVHTSIILTATLRRFEREFAAAEKTEEGGTENGNAGTT
jgi:hypothetical protein